jgi:hypothetical protein
MFRCILAREPKYAQMFLVQLLCLHTLLSVSSVSECFNSIRVNVKPVDDKFVVEYLNLSYFCYN